MTATTHITVSCLITTLTVQTASGDLKRFAIVTGLSLLSHFILDLLPHGFIAKPTTLFRKLWPTLLELLPGPVILLTAISLFGNGLLYLSAALFSVLPDIITTLYFTRKHLVSPVAPLLYLHILHRKVHWFETEHPDGSFSYRYPNLPLLAGEALFTCCVVFALLKQSPTVWF
jgi:hypothetical protein